MSAHTKPAIGLILPFYFHDFVTPVLQGLLSSFGYLKQSPKSGEKEKGWEEIFGSAKNKEIKIR